MPIAKVVSEELQTKRTKNGRRILLKALSVDLGTKIEGLKTFSKTSRKKTSVVIVPAGFDTDFSSVPALARTFMGRWDKHDIAGVVHDWLYRVGAPRRDADRAWWIVATSGVRRVNPVQGFMGWAGLRIGAWVSYRRLARERGGF